MGGWESGAPGFSMNAGPRPMRSVGWRRERRLEEGA